MVDAANANFGAGTRWIEERRAADDAPAPERETRQLIEGGVKAWREGDMKRHIAFCIPSAILVSPMGQCVRATRRHLCHCGMREPQAWASTQTVVRQGGEWKIATMQVYHPRQCIERRASRRAQWAGGGDRLTFNLLNTRANPGGLLRGQSYGVALHPLSPEERHP